MTDTRQASGQRRTMDSLTSALVYAAFAGAWILFSDQALNWLISDPADHAMVSTYKGLLFVVVTTLLLYGLLRRFEAGAPAPRIGKGLRGPGILMAGLVLSLTAMAVLRSLNQGESAEVAAWIALAGVLTLIALSATLLVLSQQADLQLAQATRIAQEERLRALKLLTAIADSSEDAIFALDLEGRLVMANRVVQTITGATLDELIGKNETSLFPPVVAAAMMADNQSVMTLDVSLTVEETLPGANGERTLLTTKSPLRDESGKAIGVLGISRDITERKQAEEALRRSEQRFRTLVNTIPDLIWLKDSQGVYLACNPRFEAFFGAREAEIVGRTDYDFVPKDLADFFRARDRAALEADGPSSNEEEVTFASDGHRELLHTIKTPIRDDTGKIIGVLGIARDISKRKQAEDELRRNNEEMQRINRATVGRELDMIELKQQVNAQARELGREPPYPLSFMNDPSPQRDP